MITRIFYDDKLPEINENGNKPLAGLKIV